jgi:rod shape-determining protein MreD
VYLAIRHQTASGALGAFVLGYFVDTFSGTLLGLNAFTLTAVYLGVHGVARHLWLERGLPLMIVVFCAALARDVAAIALLATWRRARRSGSMSSATGWPVRSRPPSSPRRSSPS